MMSVLVADLDVRRKQQLQTIRAHLDSLEDGGAQVIDA